MNDEFYIGYLDRSPPGLARDIRRIVLGIAAGVALVLAITAFFQTPAEPGLFEFGRPRMFDGIIYETPVPFLHTTGVNGGVTNYALVGTGKHGMPPQLRGHHVQQVRFSGTLIQKGLVTMIETGDPASFQVIGPRLLDQATEAASVSGEMTLVGELVDTKCYLGVMRPATGKVHRACAVRCLSGGVPPGLLLRDGDGNGVVLFLAGPGSEALRFDPQWAARTVTARGQLEIKGNLIILHVESVTLAD
jgi:hypothetical protein